jgi:hypothetical protein
MCLPFTGSQPLPVTKIFPIIVLLLGDETPLQFLLQRVALPVFENLIVLEATDHDTRMDFNRLGEIPE